jgi:hypothetical protein
MNGVADWFVVEVSAITHVLAVDGISVSFYNQKIPFIL